MNQRPRSSFFEDLIGRPESDFRVSPDLIRQVWAPGTLTNISTGQTWACGHLETPTLKRLRESSDATHPVMPGRFSVLRAKQDRGKVDVGYLQSLSENKNAVFQVASNFNSLELMHKFDERAMTEVGNYIHDGTQGPFASISAAPGLIMRHYFPFFSTDTQPSDWRQHFEGRQIELLGNCPIQVRNGYVELDSENLLQRLNSGDIKICIHRDIQVTFGLVEGNQHQLVDDSTQLVDQVFTATADLAHENRNLLRTHPDLVERRVRCLLNAAYEGTIRAAIAGGRRKVFLTLIGGGVFANPTSWIIDAIEDTIPLMVDGGLDVYLNTYTGVSDPAQAARLLQIVKSTSGELIVT